MRAWWWTCFLGTLACGTPTDLREPSGRDELREEVTLPPAEPPDPEPTEPPITTPPEPEGCAAGGNDDARGRCTSGAVAVFDGEAFSTLQGAVDAAPNGSTVWLCPGTSTEGIVLDERVLRIEAALPGFGRLDGGDQRRLVDIEASQVTLRGFAIRDGRESAEGGGIRSRNGSSLRLECMTIVSCGSAVAGGGVASIDSELVVEDVVFRGNQAQVGGAVRVVGSTADRPARFLRADFDDNRADSGGGAIAVGHEAVDVLIVEDSIFERNETGGRGGAITVLGIAAPIVSVVGGEFDNNAATQMGASLYLGHLGPADVTLQSTRLEDGESPLGSAIAVSNVVAGGTVALVDVDVIDNIAGPTHGAIQTEGTAVRIACTGCDLGDSVFDNLPHDVVIEGTAYDYDDDQVDFVLPTSATEAP